MKTEKINIKELVENPRNTRCHTEVQIREFAKSVETFGVIRPIVIDENNMILAGHGLKMALDLLGKQEVDVLRMTGLSDNEKKKLLLADNKIYSLGYDNHDIIESIIKELDDFNIPGYDAENLEALYGQSSLASDVAEFKMSEEQANKIVEQQVQAQTIESTGTPTRLEQNVQQRKQEAEQEHRETEQAETEPQGMYVICPKCGEKIYVE